ncbi:hypothetical protein [Cupriavidus gilardii]|uniref:hypothetical protein n=1 Tax=Cupriavidus gilardii TaxID=82541 RepID=UPI0015812358|nr:hypothetical protein [Cupriavidus gilardii]QKS65110.1 hypothetical protein FOB47_25830 [Cupriavidus gilardii]
MMPQIPPPLTDAMMRDGMRRVRDDRADAGSAATRQVATCRFKWNLQIAESPFLTSSSHLRDPFVAWQRHDGLCGGALPRLPAQSSPLPSIMRAPLTIHRFAGIQDIRLAVQRCPGELLQQLHGDGAHHIVQLGGNRYRFQLSECPSGRWEGMLVEVPFRHMTLRQQLLAIVRTLCRLLPCGSVRLARIRHTVGHFKPAEGRVGLIPERGFLPGDDRLVWLHDLCRRFHAGPDANIDLPASLDFRDAVVSDDDLELVDQQLRALPEMLRLDQLELILEPLCSLALPPGTPARGRRDDMAASLCDRFANAHGFEMAAARRIVQLMGGSPLGPAFRQWLENGALQLADGLAAAVNPCAMARTTEPLPGADAGTVKGFQLISRHLKDLAAVLPLLSPTAAASMLQAMSDIAAVPGGDRAARIELRTIVARAYALTTERDPAATEAPKAPRKPARVWGKPLGMPKEAHQ